VASRFAVRPQKRQNSGTTNTATTKNHTMQGNPSFQKSPKRYPPGPVTMRFPGVATGVRNEEAAATVMLISTGRAEMPSSVAAATAMGITTKAVAVLLIN
jgi:hypothetical protein